MSATTHSIDSRRSSSTSERIGQWFGSPYTRAMQFDESRMITPYRSLGQSSPGFCRKRFLAKMLANERGQMVSTLVGVILVLVLALIFGGIYTRSGKTELVPVSSVQSTHSEELAKRFTKLQETLQAYVSEQLRIDQQFMKLQLKEQYTSLVQEIRGQCNQYADYQRDIIIKWQRNERAFQEHFDRLSLKEEEFADRIDKVMQSFARSIAAVKEDIKLANEWNNATSTPTEDEFNFASAQYGAFFIASQSTATLRPKINNQLLDMFMKVETSKYPLIDRAEPLQPGDCWCFNDHSGTYAVQLAAPVFIERFEYTHTKWEQAGAPPLSAPRTLQLWGCNSSSDVECSFLAECVYALNSNSHKLTCYVDQRRNSKPVSSVELRVTGNHGQEHTCLYSFRVFGTRYSQPSKIPTL
ncbi:unnamed protein product, partial [Mesorhabditis belari]|uniref:SUN domain-containing protein n=1 Tax=Mesorhabditis belari TaxID=2138241 RepID=A0AAF3F353_9BILA